MPFRRTSIVREFTTALAVVAVYVLVLLAPLHQAAGLQKDLAELGYGSPATWSICGATIPDKGDERPAGDIKCAVAGIGKHDLSAVEPASIQLHYHRVAGTTVYPSGTSHGLPTLPAHVAQARAPPAAV